MVFLIPSISKRGESNSFVDILCLQIPQPLHASSIKSVMVKLRMSYKNGSIYFLVRSLIPDPSEDREPAVEPPPSYA